MVLAAGLTAVPSPAFAVDANVPAAQRTRAELLAIHEALARHRREVGELPADALALAPILRAYAASIRQEGGRALDGWGTPYVYRRDHSKRGYALYSAGSDGVDDRGAIDDIAAAPPEDEEALAEAQRLRARQLFPVLVLFAVAPIAWGLVRLARRRSS